MKISDDILFIIVSCVREESRLKVLKQVVENFNYSFIGDYDIQNNLIVFDNASNDETMELLTKNFKNVYRSDSNIGYWSALDFCIRNSEKILGKKHKYVHIMESDHIYHDPYKFNWCIELMEIEKEIASIKCHEYYYQLYDYYNKGHEIEKSRKHDWISHVNRFEGGKTLTIHKIIGFHDHFYLTDFPTLLHHITRYDYMIKVFDQLKEMKSFQEGDFHRLYYKQGKHVALLNGGLFHMKLGRTDVIAGSANGSNTEEFNKVLKKFGYVSTTSDRILEEGSYTVYNVEGIK